MRPVRLTTTLATIALGAAACGTATESSSTDHQPPAGPVAGQGVSARAYAALLLSKVQAPPGATVSAEAPSKALDHLPESPSLSGTPTVLHAYWTVDKSASAVYAWLKTHGPGIGLVSTGSAASTQPVASATQYLGYRAATPPASIGTAYLYLTVVSTGPTSAAIGASAVTLAQPTRPAAERVPLNPAKAVVAWSLAPGGTPVLKILTGAAASTLARDFDALRATTAGMVACPMIPAKDADITVTFTAGGHSWKATIPSCPDIGVTVDGKTMPALAFGNPFLADVKGYTGYLPQGGAPSAPGGPIPLMQKAPRH